MTTGIGIIISAAILAVVALLIAKKDKWTWKRLFLYPALIIAVVVGIIALAVSGYSNGYYGPNKIGREMEYAGIRLRSTKSDVRFVMGKAKREDALKDDDDERWLYLDSDSGSNGLDTVIWFGKDGLVTSVGVFKNGYGSLPSLKWIHEYASLKSIQDRLGEAQFIEDLDDGQKRIFRYTTHNLRFSYDKDGLRGIGIRDYERYPHKPKAALDQTSIKPATTAPNWEDLKPLSKEEISTMRSKSPTGATPPTK